MSFSWNDLTEESWHDLTEESWHDLEPPPTAAASTGFYHGFNEMLMAPLHFEGFGEPVTLHSFSGDVPLSAIVSLPQQSHFSRGGGETIVPGHLLFEASEESRLNSLVAVTARGKRFEIAGVLPPSDGVIKVSIERTEKQYTNATNALDA